jgi:hypothetical protein
MGGGGGGESAASGAANAQVEYAKQAQAQQAAYLQQALALQKQQFEAGREDLKTFYNKADSALSPYALGGYNAYDTYLGTLGQATPTGGSFALGQALNQGSKIQSQIDNWKSSSEADYRNKLLNLVNIRTQNGTGGAGTDGSGIYRPWGSQNITGHDFNSMSNEGLYNLLNTWKSDASRMVSTGTSLDGVGFRGDQAGLLSNWLNQVNSAGLKSPAEIAAAVEAEKAELEKLKQDPTYQKYLDYQQGKVNMTGADASGALSKFFNTPLYQLQFGNSGSAVDPNADPRQRFQESPGYQFQLDQGQRSIERSLAARGLLESGALVQEMNKFGQGVANQEWNNYLNRVSGTFENYQGALSNLANTGVNTSTNLANMAIGQGGNLANLGMNYANNASNIYGALGTGAANSLLAQGGALAGGIMNSYNAGQVENASMMQGFGALGGLFSSRGGKGGSSGGGFNIGGAASGASAGTAIMPGFGTAIGGVLGGFS